MADQPLYMATTLPGLEDVAGDELTVKLGGGIALRELTRGKVFFTAALPREQLLQMRSLDNLYLCLDRFPVGPHRPDLRSVAQALTGLDLTEAARAGGVLPGRPATFFVNASRAGKHTYSRFDLAAAATEGILTRHRRWRAGTPTDHELEFRLDLLDGEALFALRLSDPTFRFRGDARRFAAAALRPTVAHALVWLAGPRDDERFLDPFCGSGTIVAERAAYRARSVTGSDVAAEAVTAARANAPSVAIQQWDARQLPLLAGTVDTVATNLPFGRQILSEAELGPLYADFCRELRRVLTAGGQALLLTDQHDPLERAAAGAGLALTQLRLLSLHGLHPWVYRVGR